MSRLILKALWFIFFAGITLSSEAQNYPYLTQLSGASQGIFQYPGAITTDGRGKTYVLDASFRRLQVMTITGEGLKYVTHYPIPNSGNDVLYDWYYINRMAFLPPNKIVTTDYSNNRIQIFTLNETNMELTAQIGSSGSAPGQFFNPNGLAVDSNGKIYVCDNSNHRIQVLTTSGTTLGVVSTFGTYGSGNGQFSSLYGIAVDNNYRIFVSDPSNAQIQVLTINGTNIGYYTKYVGGYGSGAGQFNSLKDISVDDFGKIYTVESFSNRIQVFTLSGTNIGFYTQYGSTGTLPGQFKYLNGIIFEKQSKTIQVLDSDNYRIQVITSSGANLNYSSSVGGSTNNQFIHSPSNILSTASNSIYVSDIGTKSLDILTLSGNNLGIQKSILLTNGTLSSNISPWGIGFSKDKKYGYITDGFNNQILILSVNGVDFGTVNSIGGSGTATGRLNVPYGLTVDKQGKVFVADGLNHRIQVFTVSGSSLGYYTSFGSLGSASGFFNQPVGIAVDSIGKIYIADLVNNRIQVLTMSGTNIGFYTQFGTIGSGTGQFKYPCSIALDGSGKMYITDYMNSRIQVLTSSGTNIGYYAQFGKQGNGDGELNLPISISINNEGKIFVADIGNSRIQVFSGAASSNGAIVTDMLKYDEHATNI
ncbi:MAG: hypothetical protein K2Q22_00255, partial [Cytophagales bacterium]|nr:hypothetical protein [Cytophagales bacterium]